MTHDVGGPKPLGFPNRRLAMAFWWTIFILIAMLYGKILLYSKQAGGPEPGARRAHDG